MIMKKFLLILLAIGTVTISCSKSKDIDLEKRVAKLSSPDEKEMLGAINPIVELDKTISMLEKSRDDTNSLKNQKHELISACKDSLENFIRMSKKEIINKRRIYDRELVEYKQKLNEQWADKLNKAKVVISARDIDGYSFLQVNKAKVSVYLSGLETERSLETNRVKELENFNIELTDQLKSYLKLYRW